MDDIESQVVKKITWRLIPLLVLCFIANYLDRVNIGFAALGMRSDLGLNATAFAIGGGIFFLGYMIFEIPSNYLLDKVGARLWISRIMITWGLVSAATAFVHDTHSLYIIRFLLGVAEAGFFPGVVLYLTYWYPSRYHGRAIGGFLLAVPFSALIGSMISGYLLQMDGIAGFKGWQWMFLIEAIPSVILGIALLLMLPNRPESARWLSDAEKAWLVERLVSERHAQSGHSIAGFSASLKSWRVLLFGLVYLGIVCGQYGVAFFLPTIVKGFGLSNGHTGLIVAIPYAFAVIAMKLWISHSDRSGERKWHAASACFIASTGYVVAAFSSNPVVQIVAFSISTIGNFTALVSFWTLPPKFLVASAAAGGFALVNSLGNIGGFAGPYVVGSVKDATGNFSYAMAALGVLVLLSGVAILRLCRTSPDRSFQVLGTVHVQNAK